MGIPDTASAATWYFWGPEPVVQAPLQAPIQRKRPRPARPNLRTPALAEKDKPVGPLIINISIHNQRLKLYDSRGLFAESPVSTGMAGHSTPMGVFSVIEKQKWHRSNIYSGAPMPYMQRITWSGVALHQGVLPGYPASHGCIRMPAAFAIKLWTWTQRGARVIITPGEISPEEFSHPKLIAQMLPEPTLATVTPTSPAETARIKLADNKPVETKSGDKTTDRIPQTDVPLQSELRLSPKATTVDIDREEPAKTAAPTEKRSAAADPADSKTADALPSSAAETESASPAAEKSAPEVTSESAGPVTSETTAEAAPKPQDLSLKDGTEPAKPTADATEPNKGAETPAPAAKTPAPTPQPAMASAPAANTAPAIPVPAPESRDVPTVIGPKRTGHIAVFISRKERKLYVRQNFSPIFDVPVEIADPDKPLGTFVFTARGDKDDAKALRWSAVAMPYASRKTVAGAPGRAGKPGRTVTETTITAAPASAAEALDRITIPEAALERIAQVIKPGGSIVISDHGLGDETGLGTDFIVPLR